MAILGSAFALVGRFAGRFLNSALGWATILLFGKVPASKQTLLLLIALASLLWVVTIVGVVWPDIGAFLLTFVPVPSFVDEGIVRLLMLALAVLTPLAIGAAAVFVAEPASRPTGTGVVAGVLRGFPFTFVLALTIVILAAVSLWRKVHSPYRHWEDAHVPVVVKPGGYDRVLGDLHEVLADAGLDLTPRPAPALLSLPPRLLDAVAGRALGSLVPDRLMLLSGRDLEILVYPSDVAITGAKAATARARAAIAARLTASPAYLTTSAESERLEDEIRDVAEQASIMPGPTELLRPRFQELDEKLATLAVPFDEWETVYRQRLQVERDLLARWADGSVTGGGPAGTMPTGSSAPRRETSPASDRAIAALALGLLAADVVLLAADRFAARTRRA